MLHVQAGNQVSLGKQTVKILNDLDSFDLLGSDATSQQEFTSCLKETLSGLAKNATDLQVRGVGQEWNHKGPTSRHFTSRFSKTEFLGYHLKSVSDSLFCYRQV